MVCSYKLRYKGKEILINDSINFYILKKTVKNGIIKSIDNEKVITYNISYDGSPM